MRQTCLLLFLLCSMLLPSPVSGWGTEQDIALDQDLLDSIQDQSPGALGRFLLQPEVQAVLQKAVHEHLRRSGTLDAAGLDEALAVATQQLPPGHLRTVLEQAMAEKRALPQGHQYPDVADTLGRLSPEDRDVLGNYREVLSDHGRLVEEMQSWPFEVRRAAQRYLSIARSGAASGSIGLSEELIDAQDPLSAVPVFDESAFSQQQLDAYLDPSQGEIRLKAVPLYALMPHTEVYVIPFTHGAIRIYTDTAFGGAMLLKEARIEEVLTLLPTGEFEIAGNEASVSLSRYDDARPSRMAPRPDTRRSRESCPGRNQTRPPFP